MSKFHAKPIVAKKSTRPGESSEYVGTRNTVDLLPAIFQTSVNKKDRHPKQRLKDALR